MSPLSPKEKKKMADHAHREWMYTGRQSTKVITPEWFCKLEEFLNQAFVERKATVWCPCNKCKNQRLHSRDEIGLHLVSHGFVPDYYVWIHHGEAERAVEEAAGEPEEDDRGTGLGGLINDYRDAQVSEEEPEGAAKAFYDMLESSAAPLHAHTEYRQLKAIGDIMAIKARYNLSRDCFDEIMTAVGQWLPKAHILPSSLYAAKKILRALNMPYEQIHACPEGCVLFRKEYEHAKYCPKCGSSRYVEVDPGDGQKRQSAVPTNILRYLPVIPRIQRLYMDKETAKMMTWHKDGKRWKKDASKRDMLIHPSDGDAWKNFDKLPWMKEKAAEARNVRIALATDGFNPYGMAAASYSCWPVFVIPLNLPPGAIMQRKHMFLSLIIPGPNYPGQNMSVYMQPLFDELKEAWDTGFRTYDRATRTHFNMFVWYQYSIHDLPAFGLYIGWSVHGRFPCPQCKAAMEFFWLPEGHKYCCFDMHRQFLRADHEFRQDTKKFRKDTIVTHTAPPMLTGKEILDQLNTLEEDPKNPGKYKGYGVTHAWTHKPSFWDLPYFPHLECPHYIDVMHTEKNIGESIFAIMFDIADKSRDNIKARADQKALCDRPRLEMQEPRGGKKWRKPKAPFVLTREQRKEALMWIAMLMFPDGYAANLRRGVKLDAMKIIGLKSHDYHIWLERLLPVMARGFIPEADWRVLAELSYFFRILCAKEISPTVIDEMEKAAPELICKLEAMFPPSLFVPMAHMILHLPTEARMGGPVQGRWMYAPERLMKTLRQKCGNKCKIEASIAEAFIIEEVANVITTYFPPDVPTMHNPVARYNAHEQKSELSLFKGKLGTSGGKVMQELSVDVWTNVTMYVLTNLQEAKEYQK